MGKGKEGMGRGKGGNGKGGPPVPDWESAKVAKVATLLSVRPSQVGVLLKRRDV